MKKFFLAAVAALVVVGLVFVACKKEETNIDKKVANEQVVKHQKTEGDYIDIPEVFYSSDGITFYDGNGTAVTGIHVTFGEATKKAHFSTDGHLAYCTDPGVTCGNATICDDATTMSCDARYGIRNDGTIVIQPIVH